MDCNSQICHPFCANLVNFVQIVPILKTARSITFSPVVVFVFVLRSQLIELISKLIFPDFLTGFYGKYGPGLNFSSISFFVRSALIHFNQFYADFNVLKYVEN